MSGNIKFKIRKAKPKGINKTFKDIGWYPEWYLEITGEDNVTTTISPTVDEFCGLIEMIVKYERLQLFDFFKMVESCKGSIGKRIETSSNVCLDMNIEKFSDEIIKKHPVYKETLEKQKELMSKKR